MTEAARRRRYLVGAAAAVVLILLLIDWPLGRHHAFWLRHPLVAVIVGGLALLGLAAALLDDRVAGRDERRAARVAAVGFADLSRETALAHGLLRRLAGERTPEPSALDDAQSAELAGILAAHPFTDEKTVARLRVLIADRRWAGLASSTIEERSHRLREAAFRWAPAMLDSDLLGPRLLQVTGCVDALAGLTEPAVGRSYEEGWNRALHLTRSTTELLASLAGLSG